MFNAKRCILFSIMLFPVPVYSQGLTAVRPLPGYECKMLNLTQEQILSPLTKVPVRSGPSPEAKIVGIASLQVAVKEGQESKNGFVEAINASNRSVWIEAKILRPYHSEVYPTARCIPSVMSNGKIGFKYLH